MKQLGLAGLLALSSVACQRKEETTAAEPRAAAEHAAPAAAAAEEKKEEAAASKPTKASERPAVTEKKTPVAEPVADKPGFVKSPFSGQIIDVRGIPAGAMVADPMYPAAEKKHFRVPKMSPENEAKAHEDEARRELAEETSRLNGPEAKPVPGKPGFFFSPYDNKIIDANGIDPGTVIQDPGSPEGTPRYFKIPGGLPPEMDSIDH
jgi:hypothetical protein